MEGQQFRYLNRACFVWFVFASINLLVNAGGIAHESKKREVRGRYSGYNRDLYNDQHREKLDVMFILDGSQSVCGDGHVYKPCQNWKLLLQFIHELTCNWKIGPDDTRVALGTFSNYAKVEWDLNGHTEKESLLSAIDNVAYPGDELVIRGCVKAIVKQVFSKRAGGRPNTRKVVVLVSNGAPRVNLAGVDAASTEVQKTGIEVFAVCASKRCSGCLARSLSSPPKQINMNYFSVSDFTSLQSISHKLESQIHFRKACKHRIELSFLLDRSTSVCGGNDPCENWRSVLHFSERTVMDFDIGPSASKVGMAVFSNRTVKEWGLTTYTNRASLLVAIDEIPFAGGEFTDFQSATVMFTRIFNPKFGDNPNIPNVAIMITDGVPRVNNAAAKGIAVDFEKHGITFLVVCVMPGCTANWAKAAASVPKRPGQRTYFMADGYSSLDNVRGDLLKQICAIADETRG